MDTFGLSFSPTNQDRMTGQGGSQPSAGGASNPIQDAIRTLSYRIPKQTGGQGLAPSALLNAQGSAGLGMGAPLGGQSPVGPQMGGANPVMAGLEDWLRKIFAGQMNEGQMGAGAPMGSGSAPDPRFIPGVNGAQRAPEPPPAPTAPAFDDGTQDRAPFQGSGGPSKPFATNVPEKKIGAMFR